VLFLGDAGYYRGAVVSWYGITIQPDKVGRKLRGVRIGSAGNFVE
jgi:hypothetical protein